MTDIYAMHCLQDIALIDFWKLMQNRKRIYVQLHVSWSNALSISTQIEFIARVVASHTDPGELKNIRISITLEFMQWYDSIGLRMTKNWYITDCYVQLILSHTESYGVISLHELKGNGVLHIFELAWISVRRGGELEYFRQKWTKQTWLVLFANIWLQAIKYLPKVVGWAVS